MARNSGRLQQYLADNLGGEPGPSECPRSGPLSGSRDGDGDGDWWLGLARGVLLPRGLGFAGGGGRSVRAVLSGSCVAVAAPLPGAGFLTASLTLQLLCRLWLRTAALSGGAADGGGGDGPGGVGDNGGGRGVFPALVGGGCGGWTLCVELVSVPSV